MHESTDHAQLKKLNLELKILAAFAVFFALLLIGFVCRSYFHLYWPQAGDPVTFEMYQSLFEVVKTCLFVVLPLLAAAFLAIGIYIFYYFAKRKKFDR